MEFGERRLIKNGSSRIQRLKRRVVMLKRGMLVQKLRMLRRKERELLASMRKDMGENGAFGRGIFKESNPIFEGQACAPRI